MWTGIIYFVVIILANTVGAISGMGGGVIIKPVLDFIGAHQVAAISFYSSVAVFTMSIVSTLRQMKNKITVQWVLALLISAGAVAGGSIGNLVFEQLMSQLDSEMVMLIQIILTVITLLFAYFYSKNNSWHIDLRKNHWYVIVGFILGFLASLLGIGGGPINVALLMMCFYLPIKEATVYSIITIFFSQLAKLVTIGTTTGFQSYDLNMLLFIIPAAVLGGWLGAKLSGIFSEEKVSKVFQLVIFLVLLINIYNGIRIFI
ncbi:sulfite exporter TauE/SafE family protein [Vagococcus elongatus]|uniref:Probable membrane transporter protein n=1 Tax=Vagococcus elongatus TaxID=180344 RepID=A0A430B1A4_9ENTE|nr:sulfite exporter TauE/SafE family protein [Vagococcus elongatus]RSU14105.1 hypothetical protein CBF29_04080 [Vagococcus elongatus]